MKITERDRPDLMDIDRLAESLSAAFGEVVATVNGDCALRLEIGSKTAWINSQDEREGEAVTPP
jgi:hypothetical protein